MGKGMRATNEEIKNKATMRQGEEMYKHKPARSEKVLSEGIAQVRAGLAPDCGKLRRSSPRCLNAAGAWGCAAALVRSSRQCPKGADLVFWMSSA